MKIKLVTSILHYLDNDKYHGVGGRTRLERYMQSMLAIANTAHDIVMYINEPSLEEVKQHMEKHGVRNIEYKLYAITDFKHHDIHQEIKLTSEHDLNKYSEIGYSKVQMLEQELMIGDYSHVYWIDSGLSHYGLYEWSLNPNAHLRTEKSIDPNSYSFTGVFNPKLFPSIAAWSGSALVNLENNMLFHQIPPLIPIYNLESPDPIKWMSVGGLFGGEKQAALALCKAFWEKAEIAYKSNYIPNHEVVLSLLVLDNPDNFRSFQFETWYHPRTPEVVNGKISIDGKTMWQDFFMLMQNL